MLELKPKRDERYIEVSKNPVIKTLLEYVWVKAEHTGFPNVNYARIGENEVELGLKFFGDNPGAINPRGFNRKNEPHLVPFSHVYSSSKMNEGVIEFQLNPDIKNMRATFTTDKGFHSRVHNIFGTKEITIGKHPDYTHKQVGRLENVGLKGVKNLETELTYTMPPYLWRTLPEEFIENIQGFEFEGPSIRLSWPKKISDYVKVPKEIQISSSGLSHINTTSPENLEIIEPVLTDTGLVKCSLEKGQTSLDTKHRFLVNPDEIRRYESLQVLEEATKRIYLKGRTELGKTELLIKGNLSRDVLNNIQPIFDSSDSNVCRVEGYVRGGDITARYRGWSSPTLIRITLENASLEKTARLIQTGALHYCGLKLELETDKWRTIDFCKDTGYC